jgi:uncharacterized protein (DUF4415 family)
MPGKRRTGRKLTTKRSTLKNRRKSERAWKRLASLTDASIRRAVQSDPDAAPILDAAWFSKATIQLPEPKKAVSIRLDRDVMDWFRRQGKGYQTRINAVLRAYVDAHR